MSKKTATEASADSPSMEDILNSIRGVVDGEEEMTETESDDDLPDEADTDEEPEEDDILLLDTPAFEDDDIDDTPITESTDNSDASAVNEGTSQEDLLSSLFEDEEGGDDTDASASEDSTVDASEESPKTAEAAPTKPETPADDIADEDDIVASLLKAQQAQSDESAFAKQDEGALLSDTAAEASTGALKQLMRSIPKHKHESPTLRADMTLEELVVEAIRPHLSEWLNENLPDIVKHLVQKEIRKLLPDEE